MRKKKKTPRQLGFTFPAEWEKQAAMWLTWPHNVTSWPDGSGGAKELKKMLPDYAKFVAILSQYQVVCINVNDTAMQDIATKYLIKARANMSRISFYLHPSNDAWCRDHGPAFVINRKTKKKAIIDWDYNAWGNKYPHDLDNQIPKHIAVRTGCKVFKPGIVMEGGSVDFNGKGTVITTKACLLNENRNPKLSQKQIEKYLRDYYGVTNVLWLNDGIIGDDTNGHVDDITRFVNPTTVITMIQIDRRTRNYKILKRNRNLLKKMKLENGQPLKVIEMHMPYTVRYTNAVGKKSGPLPASYANFVIANGVVIVPTFKNDITDHLALETLQKCFPDRNVVGLDSCNIIWGLGSFHCLTQQEPYI